MPARRARASGALLAGVALACAPASALSSDACASRGFDARACATTACDRLRALSASSTLVDDCVACCANANDAAASRAFARASVRVCE